MSSQDLLLQVLRRPTQVISLDLLDWDALIRQARRTNLLARLGFVLKANMLLESVPDAPRRHITSALLMSERQDKAMRWELDCIRAALRRVPAPVILLKGAAYLAAGYANASGRMFGDLDLLVPKCNLAKAEAELKIHGWQGTVTDEYDQQYYRRWMHEVPPLRHNVRKTVVDLHHSILPESSRTSVNIACMIEEARPIGSSGLFVLCPVDLVLHSAAHLFHEGEFNNALRDLSDLDSLLIEFSNQDKKFWISLTERSKKTGLTRPLYYAIRNVRYFFSTDVPDHVVKEMDCFSPSFRHLMDGLYRLALRPLESRQSAAVGASRFLLYVRSHWLRMPVHLLTYHLARKFVLRCFAGQVADR